MCPVHEEAAFIHKGLLNYGNACRELANSLFEFMLTLCILLTFFIHTLVFFFSLCTRPERLFHCYPHPYHPHILVSCLRNNILFLILFNSYLILIIYLKNWKHFYVDFFFKSTSNLWQSTEAVMSQSIKLFQCSCYILTLVS